MNIKLNGNVSISDNALNILAAEPRQAVNVSGFDAICRKIACICSRLMTNIEEKLGDIFRHRAEVVTTVETASAESQQQGLLMANSFTLGQAIERLPLKQRVIFQLHDVYGYSHKDVAQQLGISVGTAKSQLHQARLALRVLLQQETSAAQTASYQQLLTA